MDLRRTGQIFGWLFIGTFVTSIPARLLFIDGAGASWSNMHFVSGDASSSSLKLGALLEFGLIVTLAESQIDAVAPPLLATRITLLCDPEAGDLAAAIAQTLVAPAPRSLPAAVADQRSDYGLPAEPVQVSAVDVRKAIRARRLRNRPFPEVLFEDPAWDMLLDLYAAHLERAQVSVSSLCIAAAVAPSTALRWIGRMTEDGLFVREPDPFDRRRAFMALSDAALDRMNRYFATLAQNGLAIA